MNRNIPVLKIVTRNFSAENSKDGKARTEYWLIRGPKRLGTFSDLAAAQKEFDRLESPQ